MSGPTPREYAQQKLESTVERARAAFKNHQLRSAGEREWWLVRRHPDGEGWDSCYATSVYADHHGQLYVGGDISAVVFGTYGDSPDPERRVRWMGRCKDLDYYVAQKATIGMTDNRKLTEDFDSDLAALELCDHVRRLEEEGAELDAMERDSWATHTREVVGGDISPEALAHQIYNDPYIPHEHIEGLGNLGRVLSTRVVYAWAALARLCDLIDARGVASG